MPGAPERRETKGPTTTAHQLTEKTSRGHKLTAQRSNHDSLALRSSELSAISSKSSRGLTRSRTPPLLSPLVRKSSSPVAPLRLQELSPDEVAESAWNPRLIRRTSSIDRFGFRSPSLWTELASGKATMFSEKQRKRQAERQRLLEVEQRLKVEQGKLSSSGYEDTRRPQPLSYPEYPANRRRANAGGGVVADICYLRQAGANYVVPQQYALMDHSRRRQGFVEFVGQITPKSIPNGHPPAMFLQRGSRGNNSSEILSVNPRRRHASCPRYERRNNEAVRVGRESVRSLSPFSQSREIQARECPEDNNSEASELILDRLLSRSIGLRKALDCRQGLPDDMLMIVDRGMCKEETDSHYQAMGFDSAYLSRERSTDRHSEHSIVHLSKTSLPSVDLVSGFHHKQHVVDCPKNQLHDLNLTRQVGMTTERKYSETGNGRYAQQQQHNCQDEQRYVSRENHLKCNNPRYRKEKYKRVEEYRRPPSTDILLSTPLIRPQQLPKRVLSEEKGVQTVGDNVRSDGYYHINHHCPHVPLMTESPLCYFYQSTVNGGWVPTQYSPLMNCRSTNPWRHDEGPVNYCPRCPISIHQQQPQHNYITPTVVTTTIVKHAAAVSPNGRRNHF